MSGSAYIARAPSLRSVIGNFLCRGLSDTDANGKVTKLSFAKAKETGEVPDRVWEAETILLCQSDPHEVLLTCLAFAASGLGNPLQIAGDGAEAIAYLSRQGQFANRR